MARFPRSGLADLLLAAERFSLAHPGLAGHLGHLARDATGERVREGLLYLAATILDQIRDVEEADGYRALAEMIAPSLMRPFPAAAIVEFGLERGAARLSAGSEIGSDGARFRVVGDVHVGAAGLRQARIERAEDGCDLLALDLGAMNDEPLAGVVGESLRLYLDGPREPALLALAHLLAHSVRTEVHLSGGEGGRLLGPVRACGLGKGDALAPEPDGPATGAERLREYFLLHERFRFVEIEGLGEALRQTKAHEATVEILFDEPWPTRASLGRDGIVPRMHCAPVVNLFTAVSEPAIVGPESATFSVRVAGYSRAEAGVYAVLGAFAVREHSAGEPIAIPPLRRFAAGVYAPEFPYAFSTRPVPSAGDDPDTLVTLTTPRGFAPMLERHVVWLELWATHRAHPTRLRPGDRLDVGVDAPAGLTARALTAASPYVPAPVGDDLYLHTLVRGSLPRGDPRFALQSLLFSLVPHEGPDARIRADRARVDAIESLRIDVARDHEAGRRGYLASMRIDERHFSGLGDVALFLRLLHAALEAQTSINSAYRCEARCSKEGALLVWPPDGHRSHGGVCHAPERSERSRGPSVPASDVARPSSSALLRYAVQGGARFRVFPLLRFLEHVLSADIDDDRIRCEQLPDLAYPVSDVAWVRVAGEGERGQVHVCLTCLGLLGVASPLSPEWSEQVLLLDDSGALRDFYNVFHHRAVVALYRGWKSRALEGGFDLAGSDEPSRRLRALAGVDAWAPYENDALPSMTALGFGDYQRGHPHTMDRESAEQLLRRLLPEWNIALETNVRRFVLFNPSELARIRRQTRLGIGVVCGDGRHDTQGLVRIHTGPVDALTCRALMPGGSAYTQLERLADRLLGGAVDIELEVRVAGPEAPRAVLGAGTRLGIDARYTDDPEQGVCARVPLLRDAERAQRTFIRDVLHRR